MGKNAKARLKIYQEAQQERAKMSAAKWHERKQELIKRAQEIEGSISLDDIVHDLKSAEASDLNNQGAAAQIDYIIEQYGVEKGLAVIEEVLS